MENQKIEKCYHDNKKLIKYIAYKSYSKSKFKNNAFINIDDIEAEANIAFVEAYQKYNPDKNIPFKKYLSFYINRRLVIYFNSISKNYKEYSNSDECLQNTEYKQNKNSNFILKDFLDSLHDDAALLVYILLDPPPEFILNTRKHKKGTPLQYRAALKRFLTNRRWTRKQINTAFTEIEEVLYA
jgi:hypothetical protein